LAGFQAEVEWQVSQEAVVLRWLDGFPGALEPLWQLAQVPFATPA
jgi:hypothetical protein